MRKLILQEWVSLDGYVEDRNGKLDFFPSTAENRYSDEDQLEFLEGVDTILLGRKTYELFVAFWPEATKEKEIIADRLNTLPKVVFSNTLREAPWGQWNPARVAAGDAVAEIRRLKVMPGKHLVLWGSVSLAHQLMLADLIDEYHIQICPTLVGGGRALFPELKSYATLKRMEVRTYESGVLFIHYEPQR